jgi:predicted XRE-type DNA-binding protein
VTAVAKSNAREARERAGRIRVGMVQYLHTLADIRASWEAQDWLALGYGSWDDYLAGEFSEERLRVPAQHRDKAIAELRMAGMSQRAIATSLTLPQSTVGDVSRRLTGSGQIEQPERVISRDGSDRPASSPACPTTPVVEAPPSQDQPGSTTAAEVEDSPPADGTESDSDVRPEPPVTPVARVADGESVPAAPEPPRGAGSGAVTPDDWSRQLRDRVSLVHEFMTVDFPADAFASATESDWAEVIDLIEQMAGYGKAIRSAYVARMLEATR